MKNILRFRKTYKKSDGCSVVGKKAWKIKKGKLPCPRQGRNSEFRVEDTLPVVAIPDIVVRETVYVRVELVTVVDVHVGNEELYDEPSFFTADLTRLTCIRFPHMLESYVLREMRGRAVYYLRV